MRFGDECFVTEASESARRKLPVWSANQTAGLAADSRNSRSGVRLKRKGNSLSAEKNLRRNCVKVMQLNGQVTTATREKTQERPGWAADRQRSMVRFQYDTGRC